MVEVQDAAFRLIPVPTPRGTRWLVRLDDQTSGAYASLVARVVPTIERSLSPAVVANRVALATTEPPRIRLEAWDRAHRRFRETARRLAARSRAALIADVRACYASIAPDVVGHRLESMGCPQGDVDPIVSALRHFAARGIRGLPVGPEASAVLANAVLGAVDEALQDVGVRHVRWVDDMIAFATGPRQAEDALGALRSALSALRLAPAPAKTRIVLTPDREAVPAVVSSL